MNKFRAYIELIKLLPPKMRTPRQLARLLFIIMKIKNGLKDAEKKS